MRKNNRKDNLKKNNQKTIVRINIIALLTSFALLIVAAVTVFLLIKPSKFEKKFMAYEGYYNTAQTPIGSSTATANYIKMSSLYTRNDATVSVKQGATLPTAGKFVSIETKDDLYAFDQLCNNTSTQFNNYNYVLLKNIDWKEGSTLYFDPINNFKGVFDGNGYVIKNLSLKPVATGTLSDNYAMFKDVNSGATIKNFGLIDPLISISVSFASGSTIYIANVCAVNHGTIDYVFVRDNQENYPSSVEHTPGMTVAVPGYHISGLVGVNEGTFTNSYFAASNIFNVTTSGKPDDFQEVLLSNSGTANNLFFYDELIADYQETGTKAQIQYSELNRTYNYNPHYGTYCTDLQDLCDKVTDTTNGRTTNWIIGSYYEGNNFGSLIDFTTPRLMKIDKNTVDYSNNKYTVVIDSVEDFNFIWNSMNENSKFSDSSMIYKISTNINMNDIAAPSYNDSIQSEFISATTSSPITIYYNNYNYYLNSTYKSYGVFPVFEGKMSYINFVVGSEDNPVTINTENTGIKAIGTAIGYAENATIDNVNVYANIAVDNAIGKYFIGGIAGAIGDKTVISNSTVAGNITTTNNSHPSFDDDIDNVNGIAIGGAVGFVAKSGGSLDTVLSEVNIKSAGYTEKEVNIGGIAGAGYFIDTNKLHNKGKIEVKTGDSGAAAYSHIHLAGVIGRIMGMYSQANNFTNNGDIDLYQAANAPTYYAGILNADIQTENVGTYSLFYKGKRQFWASKLSNGADIKIYNVNSNAVIMYTYGVNVKNNNEFQTQLSSVYNLNYRFGEESIALGNMNINMNYVNRFAPLLMSNNSSLMSNDLNSTYSISLTTAYNLRDITYTIDNAITTSTDFYYTAGVLADYVNYVDVRNEGKQEATLNKALTGNLNITGLFYELSSGFSAEAIYNGGDIDVTYTAIVTGDINASGICYANNNGLTSSEIQKYNPSNDNYDKTAVGSINNCINNGSVTVTNTTYADIPFACWEMRSSNGIAITENHWCPGTQATKQVNDVKDIKIVNEYNQTTYLDGNINVTGIAIYNYSVITNAFNIGDMFAANYIKSSHKNEINASGLVTYNIGQYAVIENCANDGDIKAINLSFYLVFNNYFTVIDVTTGQNAFVNSSGIACHNDINADGTTYNSSNGHSKQIIAFTINYGSIYSYNVRRNSTTSAAEDFRTISAGILGQGLLNTVNVMNYGNIYGSEVSGGIIGVMFFGNFKTEVNSNANSVIFANTINYSPVLVIDKGELNYRDEKYTYQTYSSFKALNNSSSNYYTSLDLYSQDYYNGSIFGIINFDGDTNAQYMKIRYLISFNEDITLVSKEASTPSLPDGTIDLSTFFSAYYKYEAEHITDKYMGKNVTYAPLSSNSTTINGVTYQGVFSQNFPFYQAIKGNSTYVDVDNHRTDIFISDYFEFVGVLYVNPILLNKIGWGSMAYNAAADSFASNLSSVIYYVNHWYKQKDTNPSPYNAIITSALNTSTWLSKCDDSLLLEVTNELIKNEDVASLLAMVRYIFSSSSSSYSLIKTSTRAKILEDILASDLSIDYSELLDVIITYANGYSTLLANSVLDSNDEAGQYLYNYISTLSSSKLESILTTYCNYLKDSESNGYFSYSTTEQKRFDILAAIFNGISDNSFYESLASLIGVRDAIDSATINDSIQMYNGFTSLTNEQKTTLYKAIIFNNTTDTAFDRLYTYINGMSTEIEYYVKMVENGYNKTSLEIINNDIASTTDYSSSTTPPSIIDERVTLWNQIRNTTIFKSYIQKTIGTEFVLKATEFRNTYQSITEPVDTADSSYGDLSYTYTFNITPSTYFYGPYKSAAKDTWDSINCGDRPTHGADEIGANDWTTIYNRSIMDVFTKEEADYLYENGYTTEYQLFYYEYVDSNSNNQFCAVQRNNENKYAFTWFKTSYITDFTGGRLNGRYDDNDIWHDEPIYVSINGVDVDVDGGGISTFNSDTAGQTDTGGYANNLQRTGRWTLKDRNGKEYTMTGTLTDWADFIIEHEERHYISFATTKLHSTRKTGIFKTRSGQRWITFHTNDTPRRVHASQYIDYSIDDLCKLDGYLTSYADGTTKDETEREIINSFFNSYFSTSSTFEKMVAAALLERNSYVDDDSFYQVTPTLNQNFTLYYTLTATVANEYNVNKKYYKLENNNYIEVNINNVTNSNYNTYYFVTPTRAQIYDENTIYYEQKDIDYYDYDYLNNFFITNIYTNTQIGGQHPFTYLYQTFSGKTVKQYLTENVSNNIKNKFIEYCASNQSAYAKLLLELVKLNSIDVSDFSISFPVYIGNSNDNNQITIENMSSFTDLSVINYDNEIYDMNDNLHSYQYGYLFNKVVVPLNSSYNRFYIFASPYDEETTLKYKLDGSANYTNITIGSSDCYEIVLNNNSSIELYAENNDIIVYEMVGATVQQTTRSSSSTNTWLYFDDESMVTEAPGYIQYTLPTANQVTQRLNTIIRNGGYSNVTNLSYTVAMSISVKNNNTGNDAGYFFSVEIINGNGNQWTMYEYSNARIPDQNIFEISTPLGNDYLGRTIRTRYSSSNGNNKTWQNSGKSRSTGYYRYRFYKISIDIQYSFNYVSTTSTNTDLIQNSTIYENALKKAGYPPEINSAVTLKTSTNYSTNYATLLKDATHNLIPVNYMEEIYKNTLVSNTYYVRTGTEGNYTYSLATKDYDSSTTYYSRTGSGTQQDPYVYNEENSLTANTYYSSCTSNTYFVRSGTEGNYTYSYATGNYSSSTTYYKYVDSEYVEIELADSNITDLLELSATHTSGITPEYCVPDLLKLLITSSNEAFLTFVNNSIVNTSSEEQEKTHLSIIIRDLISEIGYISLGDTITSRNTSLVDNSKNIIAAAYFASDYRYILKNNTNVYDSNLNVFVSTQMGFSDRYFVNPSGNNYDGNPYDITAFQSFCQTIGYDLSTTGYGIYALASNQGKLNGQFIPDNLELDTMDTYYEVTFTYGDNNEITNKTCKLVSLGQGETEYSTNASWRGGTALNEDDDSHTTSVNYAFHDEMKQLIQSISTTVFDLTISTPSDPTDPTNTSKDIYYGDIDLDNKTITYYVNQINSSTTFTVENIDLAYKAKAYDGSLNSYSASSPRFGSKDTPISQTESIVKAFEVSSINDTHQFTVFAEDTTVHSVYTIVFKQLTTTLTMTYSDGTDSKTIKSSTTDTTVTLNITSANEKLRKGLNLEHYLSFVNTADNSIVYKMNSEFITISALSTDHRIKEDGSAVATMVVSYKIPAGTYHITLSICGIEVYVTYTKEASSECTIVAKFNGGNDNIFASGMTANSEIPFGRLYNNIELTDYDDFYNGAYGEFYLDYFEYSANATLTVTAAKETIDVELNDEVLYQKYKYTITYVIVAEDGKSEHTKTYVHTLTEKDPYSTGDQYANVTKDGNAVTYINSQTGNMYEQTDAVTNDIVVSLKYDSEAETRARVQFDRADANGTLNEPVYRITYNMDNMYISPYVVFSATDVTSDENIAGSATVKTRYHGLSGEFSSNTETGYYELMYTYTNNGKWYTLDTNNRITLDENNQVVVADYSSIYNFPILQVNKLFSLDATLHSITFIDSYKGISAASTGMRVGPMRPTDTNIANPTDTDEICYEDQLDNRNNWGIAVDVDGTINYHNFNNRPDYGSISYKDYYIVGSIANAQLSNYAPTFRIEDNAMIFQYVTARIRNDYGFGKQTNQDGTLKYSDTQILSDHTTTNYLYVPFTYMKNGFAEDAVFLVELAANGKTLTNVYTAKGFDAVEGATIGRTIYQCATQSAAITFTYEGVEYTLNKAAFGKTTNNASLYMDYIGSPVEDHFWYVSYVVYSENYIKSNNNTYVKYYHIALIDRSNNVYFEVNVIVPADFDINKYSTLYMLINGYHNTGTTQNPTFDELAVGSYVIEPTDYTLNNVAKKIYKLRYSIQMLPSAYYFFNLDLPVGYQIEATITNKPNAIGIDDYLGGNPRNDDNELAYEGAYLPPSSIVAQVVKVTLNVTEGTTADTDVWGISSSDVYSRRATLDNDQIVGN